MYFSHFDQFFT